MKNTIKWFWVFGLLCFSATIFAQGNLQKANKYYDLHAYKSAIVEYKNILNADPNNGEALSKLGRSYYYTNRMSRAVEYLQKALVTANADVNNYYYLGQSLKALERYDEAKRAFQAYARENPEKADQLAKSCDYAKQAQEKEAFFKPVKEYLNTADADFGAAYFDRKIIYSSSRTDIKSNSTNSGTSWTGEAPNKLFITRTDRKGKLERPEILKSSFKAKNNEGPASFSSDSKMVVYTKNNFTNGVRQLPEAGVKLNLFFADLKAQDDWREEKAFPFNGNDFSTGYPFLSDDKATLYFASNRPGGYGGFDLYVSYKRGNAWSTPQNLGPEFNTPGNEITPFIEGNTMYFASDWHLGFGGFDMFMATSTGKGWGNIVNLGKGINSSYDDYGFIFNSAKNYGYFTSNRPGGKGNEDIYGATRQKPVAVANNPEPTQPENIPTDMDAQIVELAVLNSFDKTPVSNASIDFKRCGEGIFTTDINGVYKFRAEDGVTCDVEVNKQGYESKLIKFSMDNRAKRYVEVLLDKIDGRYYGIVIEETTRKPQAGVKVTATNIATKARMEATTNSEGRYALGLANNSEYVVQFSKALYTITTVKVKTGDGSNKNILGIQPIRPSATVVVDTETPPGDPNNDGNDVRDPNDPTTNVPKRPLPNTAYEIQIGAFRNANPAEISRLNDFGFVYSQPAGQYKRYKVGVFRTKEQAEEVKQKIISELGLYKDAIITVTKDNELITRAFVEEGSNLPPGTQDKPNVDKPKEFDNDKVVYKVQLGVYSNPKNFDMNKVKGLGTVQQQPRKLSDGRVLTVILLGDFTSKSAAEQARKKAQSAGIPQPFVVKYQGDKRI